MLQVLFVLDPTLVPILFDRALYPPNGNILDRPVQEFMVQIDAVRCHLVTVKEQVTCMLQDYASTGTLCQSFSCHATGSSAW